MIVKIKKWLNKPYYSPIFTYYNLSVSMIFGLIVTLFLIIFQPFRIYLLGENLVLFCFGFGLISTFSLIFILSTIPKIFKNYFNPESRTIFKQFILLNICLITTASIIYPYNTYIRESINQEYIAGYFKILLYSYSVGFFPILFWLYFDELIIRKKRKNKSDEVNLLKRETNNSNTNEIITLTSKDTKDLISFKLNSLIYIKSEGNYVIINILDNGILKEKVFRTTLNKIEEKLLLKNNIIRCHKSYIINTNFIDSFSGNARGYFIKISNTNIEIPVSRRYNKEDLKRFIGL